MNCCFSKMVLICFYWELTMEFMTEFFFKFVKKMFLNNFRIEEISNYLVLLRIFALGANLQLISVDHTMATYDPNSFGLFIPDIKLRTHIPSIKMRGS